MMLGKVNHRPTDQQTHSDASSPLIPAGEAKTEKDGQSQADRERIRQTDRDLPSEVSRGTGDHPPKGLESHTPHMFLLSPSR